MNPGRRAGPTAGPEGYEFLGVLRGVALADIVLANRISPLAVPLSVGVGEGEPEDSIDRPSVRLSRTVLIGSKFDTIFSVLFGIGSRS
jgi:uncharacterized membrane protein YeiB